jgi:GH24 family phage-related lysozyme (muramidase)
MPIQNLVADEIEIAIQVVSEFEGFKSEPYYDGGQYSVGHGINADWARSRGYDVCYVSEQQAVDMLKSRLFEDRAALQKQFPIYNQLRPSAKAAILSVWHNCPALIGPKFTAAMSIGDIERATYELTLGSNPKNQFGLVVRRYAEANMIRAAYNLSPIVVPNSMTEYNRLKHG